MENVFFSHNFRITNSWFCFSYISIIKKVSVYLFPKKIVLPVLGFYHIKTIFLNCLVLIFPKLFILGKRIYRRIFLLFWDSTQTMGHLPCCHSFSHYKNTIYVVLPQKLHVQSKFVSCFLVSSMLFWYKQVHMFVRKIFPISVSAFIFFSSI